MIDSLYCEEEPNIYTLTHKDAYVFLYNVYEYYGIKTPKSVVLYANKTIKKN